MRQTLSQIRRTASERLAAAGVDTADLDARLLVEHATGFDQAGLIANGDAPLSEAAAARFEALLERRIAREPMSHILGSRGFWTLDIAVTCDALTPRPDSETLVHALLAAPAPDNARVLDLGVGPGTLLLALLSERPNWTGVGVDCSEAALRLARKNTTAHGLGSRARFVVGDWDRALQTRFDLIACNPPYIPSAELAGLAPEVRDFEPRLALDGGLDGLDPYRRIIPRLPDMLAKSGVAAFEVGVGQSDAVVDLISALGWRARTYPDLSGRTRVVSAHDVQKSFEN